MSSLPTVPQFTALSTGDRLAYLISLLSDCSHEELLSVQSTLTKLFYRDFSQLPLDIVVQILKFLSLGDILSCMLVNKTWCDIINCRGSSTLWRMHSLQLSREYSTTALLTNNTQWKQLCRSIKTFQNNLVHPFAYRNKPLVKKSQESGKIRVFRVLSSDNWFVIHGYNEEWSNEVVLVWKLEGNVFVCTGDILGKDVGSNSRTLAGSQVSTYFRDKFILIAHYYLDIFKINYLGSKTRIPLPSMSGLMHLDFLTNEEGHLHVLAILSSDYSIFLLNPNNGELERRISVGECIFPNLFNFSLLPKPALFICSTIGFQMLNILHDKSFRIIDSLQTHFDVSNITNITFKLSKDRGLLALLCSDNNQVQYLHIYSTSNWLRIRKVVLNIPVFNEYVFLSVGKKYIVLLNYRRRLEIVVYDVQRSGSTVKSVMLNEITALRDTFTLNTVLVLSERWLDGFVDEGITDVERKEKVIPMFLIFRGDTLNSIFTLFLHC